MADETTDRNLLESERNFRLLVEGITDYAIFMLDPRGRVTNWNAGAERIKGYKASEIVGKHFSVFYTPEDLAIDLPAARSKQPLTRNISSLKVGGCARTDRAFLPPS